MSFLFGVLDIQYSSFENFRKPIIERLRRGDANIINVGLHVRVG